MIHLTPIIVLGYYVVQWDVNALVKFVAIALPSLAVTLLVYEFGVRRTAATRFLFGMKEQRRQKVELAPRGIGVASDTYRHQGKDIPKGQKRWN